MPVIGMNANAPSSTASVDSPAPAAGRPAYREDARMEDAAHQFEASLLHELFAPLENDPLFSDEEAEPGGTSGSSSALVGFASDAMARALSDHGGFGIAEQIIQHLKKQPQQQKKETVGPAH